MSRETLGLDRTLNDYIAAAGDPEHPVATRLRLETETMPNGGLQISVEQGQLLAFLVRLTGARSVLEVGTFCGYSALWMALALPADGRLVACDINADWTAVGRRHWDEAGVGARIDLRVAPAAETLAGLVGEGGAASFDMAFIDADKAGYPAYFETVLTLLRHGGLMVFDNTLYSGGVADPAAGGTAGTIRAFNAALAADGRVDRVLVPIGDGMTLVRKR